MTNKDYLIRIFVIILALSFPIVCLFHGELRESLSKYFNSPLQSYYLLTNVLTAYLLYSLDEWKCPAIFLLILTVFPVDGYKMLHNIFAYAFFISCFKPIFNHNRLQPYAVPYLLSLVVLTKSFIWTEIICILTLCSFHSHLLYLRYKVDNTRKKQNNEVTN
jgi:hypothetical protein